MFSQADLKQVEIKGHSIDPTAIQLAALVKNNHQRIRNYFDSVQTRVDSGHLILKLISQIGYSTDPDYETVEWACRRRLIGIGNAERLTSMGEYGKVFNGVFIEGQDEIISLVARPIDPELSFKEYAPAKYLYHEYTNLNWALGNGKPRGVSIIEINLVELLWQHVKAFAYYNRTQEAVTSPVYAWRHVISRMLPSYMDLAFLNIHRYTAMGIEIEHDTPLRTLPTPPLRDLAVRNAVNTRRQLLTQNLIPGVVLAHIIQPFAHPFDTGYSAIGRIQHRDPGITFQGSWHQTLINWYWMLYCLEYNQGQMDAYLKDTSFEVHRYQDTRVLNKLPKSIYSYYRNGLIGPLLAKCEK